MHQTERIPSTYRHRGYTVRACQRMAGPTGWVHWAIFRPDDTAAPIWAASLAEARELIEADRLGVAA